MTITLPWTIPCPRDISSFMAYLTTDRVLLQKTYPEQAAAVRFPVWDRDKSWRTATAMGCFGRKFHNICEKDYPGRWSIAPAAGGGL